MTTELITKMCTKCNIEKNIDEYHFKKSSKDGKNSYCKNCKKQVDKIYAQHNQEQLKKYKQEYYQLNKEKSNKKSKLWVENNLEKRKENARNWARKNRKLTILKAKERRVRDLHFKLSGILRHRVNVALKSQNSKKCNKTLKLIGCTIKELKQHLESKFQSGMNWNNHGFYGWHIDHIRPCASFDLSDPEQQNICFHYTNLQPLWAQDNLSKHAKWNEAA